MGGRLRDQHRFFGRATGAILRWEGFCAWRMKPSQETCL
jgi:hypothetical protein